jgi:hypothetical protein
MQNLISFSPCAFPDDISLPIVLRISVQTLK